MLFPDRISVLIVVERYRDWPVAHVARHPAVEGALLGSVEVAPLGDPEVAHQQTARRGALHLANGDPAVAAPLLGCVARLEIARPIENDGHHTIVLPVGIAARAPDRVSRWTDEANASKSA